MKESGHRIFVNKGIIFRDSIPTILLSLAFFINSPLLFALGVGSFGIILHIAYDESVKMKKEYGETKKSG